MTTFKDLTGLTFGRLKVLRRVANGPPMPSLPSGTIQYECECSCPAHTRLIVRSGNLSNMHTLSCGCLQKERASETHRVWKPGIEKAIANRFKCMKQRCYDPGCDAYQQYGARGIKICDEWMDPETGKRAFVDWSLANGFSPELELDRINNPPYDKLQNGPYAPWNCRWATKLVQANNKRSNVFVEIHGIKHSIADWARLCKQDYTFLKHKHDRAGCEVFKDIVLYNLRLNNIPLS